MKPKTKLNITGYPENAADNFSDFKLAVITVISLTLTVALMISIRQEQGSGLLFSLIALAMIVGYDILNIMAWIRKIRNK